MTSPTSFIKENIMNLVTFNPEQTLDSFFDTDRFFGFPKANLDNPIALPKVNVVEKDEAFYLEAETPGMTDKDISVEFNDGVLILKGHREQASTTEETDYNIQEFTSQSFERSFRISNKVNSETVSARIDKGILKVTLPKKEQAKPKKIKVTIEP
jgi:HSP20 family protein